MKLIVTSDQLCKIHSDTWIYWMFEGDEEPFGAGPEIDPVCRKEIGRILSAGDFGGKSDQNALLYVGEGRTSERILLIGLGKREAFNPEILRIAYAQAVMKIQALKAKRVATYLFWGKGPQCRYVDRGRRGRDGPWPIPISKIQDINFRIVEYRLNHSH